MNLGIGATNPRNIRANYAGFGVRVEANGFSIRGVAAGINHCLAAARHALHEAAERAGW